MSTPNQPAVEDDHHIIYEDVHALYEQRRLAAATHKAVVDIERIYPVLLEHAKKYAQEGKVAMQVPFAVPSNCHKQLEERMARHKIAMRHWCRDSDNMGMYEIRWDGRTTRLNLAPKGGNDGGVVELPLDWDSVYAEYMQERHEAGRNRPVSPGW